MKNYNQAPLPFMGQKRKFAKQVKDILAVYSDDVTIVDLFGGSGLLSHTAKSVKPKSNVIYNDFDNYLQRIDAIPTTNSLLDKIRNIVGNYPENKKLTKEMHQAILDVIKKEEQKREFVDYITLSSSLLFSMKYTTSYEELAKQTFYNTVRKSDYSADGYLEGVEVVSMDYKDLYTLYKNEPNTLFFVDPPYLSTEVGTYTMSWTLSDYLDVLTILQENDYIYFTSNKSNIIELCEWIGKNKELGNPFKNATQVRVNSTMNYTSKYTDIMVYKKKP